MADRHEEKDLDEAAACWCGNMSVPPCPAGKCPNAPKPETQAETVLSERCLPCDGMGCVHCGLFGTVEVEPRPSEEEQAYQKWGSEPAIGPLDTRHIFSDGFQAGRASLAGELASWKLVAEELGGKLQSRTAELEAEKAAHLKAERERRESNGWLSFLAARCGIGRLQVVTSEELVRGVCDALASARQARVMPSREALARTIYETTPGSVWGDTWEAADAVLRLLTPTQAVHVERAAEAVGPLEPGELVRVAAQPTEASSDPPHDPHHDPACGVCGHVASDHRVSCGATCEDDEKCACQEFLDAPPSARYVPSVGERAVLVASPDPADAGLVGSELRIDATLPDETTPRRYWRVGSFAPWSYVHRDATWRRAQPQGPAGATFGPAALNRSARPVEPAAGVATPPRRFATPAEALECLRETIAEECHQEHPAHEAIGALETVEANLVRPEHAVTLPERFEALSKRVADEALKVAASMRDTRQRIEELELQGRVVRRLCTDSRAVLNEATWARIECEERAKAHTGADPLTKT